MCRPVVSVILATYNGARFLPEQLTSLAKQTRRPDRVVLRDDGSTDASVALVQEWARCEEIELQVIAGPNLGPARSFMTAAGMAAASDVFLFCDQDDFWLPHKIERALHNLVWGQDAPPTLYATRLQIVDENLQPTRLSELPVHLSFSSAVCESLLTGCTMAFNNSFRDLLCTGLPDHVLMHDWWCYLLASGVNGAVLHFDPEPSILYRQHASNAVGAGPTGYAALSLRVQGFLGPRASIRYAQLLEFSQMYGALLAPDAAKTMRALLGAKSRLLTRLLMVFSTKIHRQSFVSNLSTRFSILTNRY